MRIGFEESSTVEFKEKFPQKGQIAKTCVAFCNLYGGSIYVGVRDDGTITGVSEDEIQQSIEFLGKHVYESCSPPIIPRVFAKRYGEHTVLVIEVSSGMNKPYYLSREGTGKGVYIRVGRSTLRAAGEVSTGELVKMVNIPRSTLVRKLNVFLEQNKIVKSGKGRSVRYSVQA